MDLQHLKIISAGAGSGKTYRLTQELVALLRSGQVRASGIIATTFTRKAAAELHERVRVKLLEEGLTQQADELTNALIGTVHGLGVKLLRRFAFEAGVSPQVDILPDGEQQNMFNLSLAAVLSLDLIEEMDALVDRLGLTKRSGFFDWRKEVRQIVDVARANDFSLEDINHSRKRSWESLQHFLPEANGRSLSDVHTQLLNTLTATADTLEQGEDHTKTTSTVIDRIRSIKRDLELKGHLNWYQWAAIGKLKPGAKSRDIVEPLCDFAEQHEALPAFQQDIRQFIDHLFHTAIAAIREFDRYKKERGLIDYTDMEVLVSRLLDNQHVREVLRDELDLLMVDEFQDTNPIQLEIFLKLSQLAKLSVWVGDPKQSIYGFRGAEPRLMKAIIEQSGGIKAENIQTRSWRSRADLVYAANAIFDKAFPDLPVEQIALDPVRVPEGNKFSSKEPIAMEQALIHWHFEADDDNRRAPGKPWMEEAIARALAEWLEGGVTIYDKSKAEFRKARAGDIAVLCRSNAECETMATALHHAGVRAAIARAGLLETAEARLVMACLKFVLNARDSLSIAEILLLAGQHDLKSIVENRLDYLQEHESVPHYQRTTWGIHSDYIARLEDLRERMTEMSSTEILNLLLEELDLRRTIVRWGRREQRLSNVDELRRLALEYEENCTNTHTAASLGGFLLWLNQLNAKSEDYQGAGEDPQAVNVLTYHRSKGLEWPVVICHSLEQKLRADLWGIDLVAEQEEVDLEHVLKGRWLRYWVNPYADQQTRTPLLLRLAESEEQKLKSEQALAEEARLLYVGLTRARDYLILPTRMSSKTGWLNRVCHQGDGDTPTLDPHTHETPWDWQDRFLDKHTQTFVFPRTFPVADITLEDAPFLPPAHGQQAYPSWQIRPIEEAPQWGLTASLGRSYSYDNTDWPLEADRSTLGRVLQYFLLADYPADPKEDRLSMATGLLERFGLTEEIEATALLQFADHWWAFNQREWSSRQHLRRMPVQHPQNGRLFEAQLDWVLEGTDDVYLIQNSKYTGDDLKRRAADLGAFFYAAQNAWQAAGAKPATRFFVNFVLKGQLVEVVLQSTVGSSSSHVAEVEGGIQGSLFD